MIRSASSASSGCTEIRTSPRALMASGKMDCGTSDAVTVGTPCASSSPRTTLASTSDCVRKMTTRSATRFSAAAGGCHRLCGRCGCNGRLVDLEQDHRHVVVLRRGADERLDLAQNALAQLR